MATATRSSRSALVGTLMGDIQSIEERLSQLKRRIAALEAVDEPENDIGIYTLEDVDDMFDDIDDLFEEDDDHTTAELEVPAAFLGRLSFDRQVSETSPLIRGTWITVEQVVDAIVDGYSWSAILRTHPELTADDIRTALMYTVAEEESALGMTA